MVHSVTQLRGPRPGQYHCIRSIINVYVKPLQQGTQFLGAAVTFGDDMMDVPAGGDTYRQAERFALTQPVAREFAALTERSPCGVIKAGRISGLAHAAGVVDARRGTGVGDPGRLGQQGVIAANRGARKE